MVVLVAQAPSPNGAHEALDSLDSIQLPTRATLTLVQSDQAVAGGFEPAQGALARAGVLDVGLRITALVVSGLVTLQTSSVIASLSPDPLLVGSIGGLVTGGVNALLHFLWVTRGGTDIWRAVELHNDALLARARTQSTDPSLDLVMNRLLLVGVPGRTSVKQGGRQLSDDELAQVLVGRPALETDFREARQLHGLGTILQVVSFVVLGATPLAVGALRPPLAGLVGISLGGFLAACGVMTAGLLVGSRANEVELQVLDAWNRELLSDARKRLPLRVPEPDPVSAEPEPHPEEPPLVQPPTSDVPLKRLVLPGLVPTTP